MQISSWSQELAAAGRAWHDAGAAGSADVLIGGLILFLVLIIIGLAVLTIVARWQVFKKADMPGWAALVPVYNTVKTLQMGNRPLWWIVPIMVPIVGFVFSIFMLRRVAGVFGRGWGFAIGLLFLPFIFYPILGFGSARYDNTYPSARPLTEATKWTLIGFAAILFLETFYLVLGAQSHDRIHPLTVLGDSGFATDGQYVYLNDTAIPGVDPASFKVNGDYAMDDSSVYDYNGNVIPDADPATFKVLLGGAYAEDNGSVYYDGTPIDADPASFQALDGLYGKDASAVYEEGQVVDGADPSTFVAQQGVLGTSTDYDAKDANHYYYYGEVVQAPRW